MIRRRKNRGTSRDASTKDAPTLNETPFADPVYPPARTGPARCFQPPETENLLIAELLPPVEAAPPIGWVRPIEPPQSVAVDGTQNLPPTPAIIQAEKPAAAAARR